MTTAGGSMVFERDELQFFDIAQIAERTEAAR
jgi:hypothetical protein